MTEIIAEEKHPKLLLRQIFEEAGFSIDLRENAQKSWESALEQCRYVPVAYTSSMLDYQLAYHAGFDETCEEISIVILQNGKPCAVWPLMYRKTDNTLTSLGDSLYPPLFCCDFRKTMKSVITCCHWVAASHAKNKGATGYAGQEVFIGTEKFGLGEWYLQAVKSGAYASIRHDLFVDLRLPLENIWSSLRKSYKSLINSGSKIWINSIQKSGNEDIWEEFELLHREAAGRRTRSKKTWDIQHEAVASGQAFLVYLRDKNKRMVGGGFFHTSKIEGVYAVGAYNRSLFANPIGHIVQWEAIMEMKRRGLLWYKIGTASYSGDCPEPTEKERSISHFKEGFATHHFAALRFECQVNRGDQEKCNDK